jgi:hypothetical protein
VSLGNRFFNPLRFWEPECLTHGCAAARREKLLEATQLLARAEGLLRGLGGDSLPGDLVLADVMDGEGWCHGAAANVKRALECHKQAMALRLRHISCDHLLLGHSHLNCGLALAAMQVTFLFCFLHFCCLTCVQVTVKGMCTFSQRPLRLCPG